MLVFLLMFFLLEKFVADPFWIRLACACPVDQSETTLLLL
jgi:hypothetical protein